MIQKVKTDAGERWAIVFRESYSLEDFVSLQNGLIGVLQASTHSDMLGSIGNELYYVYELFSELIPTHTQANDCERFLKAKPSKT